MARNPTLVTQKLAADMFRTTAKIVNGTGGEREINGLLDIGADQIAKAQTVFQPMPGEFSAVAAQGMFGLLQTAIDALRAAAEYVGRPYETDCDDEEF